MERKTKIKKKRTKTELPLNQIICDHNVRAMRKFADNSIDSIICDPQYGLGFMGKGWDKVLPSAKTWKECLRVAKPGAFMFVFGGTRTFHRVTCAIEDAGWQIRDCLMWLYGSGFPKSLDISKAIDKSKGKTRKVIGQKKLNPRDKKVYTPNSYAGLQGTTTFQKNPNMNMITAPACKLAQLWDGYGTALKPAWEPIIVVMKPVDGNFAKNAEKWGVAGLNIDGGRVGIADGFGGGSKMSSSVKATLGKYNESYGGEGFAVSNQGRWPANVILDEESAVMLDKQSGNVGGGNMTVRKRSNRRSKYGKYTGASEILSFGDSGGASRFFYIAKASRSERNAGLSGMPEESAPNPNYGGKGGFKRPTGEPERELSKCANSHPTVKPLRLMKYLCKLLKMPSKDQVILDPFAGSGTTCVACKELGINYIGIDNIEKYCEIAIKRLKAVRVTLFENLPRKKSKKKKVRESFGLCK